MFEFKVDSLNSLLSFFVLRRGSQLVSHRAETDTFEEFGLYLIVLVVDISKYNER